MGMLKKIAKIIRVITIPPVLVIVLLSSLYITQEDFYANTGEFLLSVVFLMVIPILAYPISYLIPSIRAKGRSEQRKLAFICAIIGYFFAFTYSIVVPVSPELRFLFITYFLSIIMLTLFNKVISLHASGHACSITGPLVLMTYFIGWKWLLPCLLVFILIIWSSLVLKRHTIRELFFGSLYAIIAFLFNLMIGLL